MNPRTLFSYQKTSLFGLIAEDNQEAITNMLSSKAYSTGSWIGEKYSKKEVVLNESVFHTAARLGKGNCLTFLLDYAGHIDLDKLIAVYYDQGSTPIPLTPIQLATKEGNQECISIVRSHQKSLYESTATLPKPQRMRCDSSEN